MDVKTIFNPWGKIHRLQHEVDTLRLDLEKANRTNDALSRQLEDLEFDHKETIETKDGHIRKLGTIMAIMKGLAALIIFMSLNGFGQVLIRNVNAFDPSQFGLLSGTATITITNLPGIFISGPITGMVFIANDTVAHLDAMTPGLAELLWGYDVNRLTVGDGSTPGGVPVGYRYVASLTNFQTLMRTGELAITYNQPYGAGSVNYGPTLWMNAGRTNPVPVVSVISGQGTNTYPAFNVPLIALNAGSFGLNGTLAQGAPGAISGSLLLSTIGSGGNSVSGGVGGKGGGIANGIIQQGGVGGHATNANSFGGAGGAVGSYLNRGGKGGNDFQGAGGAGGAGGSGGNDFRYGGDGADDGAVSNGGNGGNSGSTDLHGAPAPAADASGGVNGGNGGSITSVGVSSNNAGSLAMSATANRAGGNTTTFGSSYAPMTIFTTTTSTGPNATASETSLLGTAAFLAPPTGQNSGKVIASNVVDHVGRILRFSVTGEITNNAPSLQLKIKLGTTVILSTDSVALVTTANITNRWRFTGQATFRTTGTSGTVLGEGFFEEFSTTAPVTSFATTNLATVTVSTATDQTIDCTATFSAATGQMIGDTAIFELVN